ncbi:MAG: asparaginase, partial [Xanthomonadaceae bacterium]|nr:asparaginase [Xanthomonadaceae bacterium]
MSQDPKKRVLLITTGGTISAHHQSPLDRAQYCSGHYLGEDFLKALPEVSKRYDITVKNYARISSTEMGSDEWIMLKMAWDRALNDDGFDGVVISHGTNTLEETAYFLHLTLKSDKPVVLTGAQRPFTHLSSDALSNLYDAFLVATSDSSHGKGVLVVANNRIYSARDVTKTATYHLETFQSPSAGPIGSIEPDDEVHFTAIPMKCHTLNSAFSTFPFLGVDGKPLKLPKVAISYSYSGAEGVMIEALLDTHYQGIVVAGTGAGRVSKAEEIALKKAQQQGIALVMSSRVGSGHVVKIESYEDLFIPSRDLNPQKARILLMLGIYAGYSK